MNSKSVLQSAKSVLVFPLLCVLIQICALGCMLGAVSVQGPPASPPLYKARNTVYEALWDAERVTSLQCINPDIESYRNCMERLEHVEKSLADNPDIVATDIEGIRPLKELVSYTRQKMSNSFASYCKQEPPLLGSISSNETEQKKAKFRLNNVTLSRDLFSKLQNLPELNHVKFANFAALQNLFHIAFLGLATIVGICLASAILSGLRYRLYFSVPLKRLRQNSELLLRRRQPLQALPGASEFIRLQEIIEQTSEMLSAGLRREQLLIDKAAELICSTDAERRIVSANSFACAITGFSKNELEGSVLELFVVPEDKDRLCDAFAKTMSSGQNASCEVRVLSKSGEKIASRCSLFWSPVEKRMFCVAQDIRQEKEAESLKDNLSAMLGEDLRKPLLEMKEMLACLTPETETTDEELRRELSQMQNNCDRLLILVDDLLVMQKSVSQEIILEKETIQVKALIVRAVESIEHLVARKNLKIQVCDEKGSVVCDRERINQVITNMLSNAIKFSPEGAVIDVAVQVIASQNDDEQSLVEIAICDSGPGVPAEQMEKIFHRFEQSSPEHAGTGLGLALSKMIIESHGGRIGVNSPVHAYPPHGSRFWFTLPTE
ncbi:MAG: PAS domain-containing sensor histidine kinase [Candidatus Obscuribacterales bacterium]|nr:PAS domain-containing sensor histidine kinase [Candidatus Obscuribacterales bacterium]